MAGYIRQQYLIEKGPGETHSSSGHPVRACAQTSWTGMRVHHRVWGSTQRFGWARGNSFEGFCRGSN